MTGFQGCLYQPTRFGSIEHMPHWRHGSCFRVRCRLWMPRTHAERAALWTMIADTFGTGPLLGQCTQLLAGNSRSGNVVSERHDSCRLSHAASSLSGLFSCPKGT
jgi:hypothetical protein